MLDLLRKLLRREPPLIPSRGSGRPRTYSADSGYVYTYSFAGFRQVKRHGELHIEYVFDVTGARETPSAVAILLNLDKLPLWTETNRELTASERYGVAKLCLKRALDRFPDPKTMDHEVVPDWEEIAEVADTLDL